MRRLWVILESSLFVIALGLGIAIQGHLAADSARYSTYIVTVSGDIGWDFWSALELHKVPPPAEGDPADAQEGAQASAEDAEVIPEGIPLTPSMRAITLLMVVYFSLRFLVARSLRQSDATADIYYYLGFLLTISAIAVGMGGAPDVQSNPSSVMTYITRVVQETGSAIWSTIFGLLLRLLGEPLLDTISDGQGGPSGGGGSGRFIRWFKRLISEAVSEALQRTQNSADAAGAKEPPKGSADNGKSANDGKGGADAAADSGQDAPTRPSRRRRPNTWTDNLKAFFNQ